MNYRKGLLNKTLDFGAGKNIRNIFDPKNGGKNRPQKGAGKNPRRNSKLILKCTYRKASAAELLIVYVCVCRRLEIDLIDLRPLEAEVDVN